MVDVLGAIIAVEDNLDELRGPVGPEGKAGALGPQGFPGERGIDGHDGKAGLDGPPGPDGAQGQPGQDGADGDGISWRGPWKPGTYDAQDAVELDGSSYIARARTRAKPPGGAWDLMAKRGSDGGTVFRPSLTGGGGSSSSGSGLPAGGVRGDGLVKLSGTNGDAQWVLPPFGFSTGREYVTGDSQDFAGGTLGGWTHPEGGTLVIIGQVGYPGTNSAFSAEFTQDGANQTIRLTVTGPFMAGRRYLAVVVLDGDGPGSFNLPVAFGGDIPGGDAGNATILIGADIPVELGTADWTAQATWPTAEIVLDAGGLLAPAKAIRILFVRVVEVLEGFPLIPLGSWVAGNVKIGGVIEVAKNSTFERNLDVLGAISVGDSFVLSSTATNPLVDPNAPTYTESNVTTDRTFNANATSIDELADVLGTLIADLRTLGILL